MLDDCGDAAGKNSPIEAATPPSEAALAHRSEGTGARSPARPAAAAIAAAGLACVSVTAFLIAAGAAGGPTQLVPARSGGWPAWLAGPLAGITGPLSQGGFDVLVVLMCVGYALALAGADALPRPLLAAGVALPAALLALGPPLLSQDVFGYLAFARMGVLHGLDPYTHLPSEMATDPSYPFLGWPFLHSPYGPLFTLASYPTAWLGPAGGMWVLKAAAAAAALAAAWLCALAARLNAGGRHGPGAFAAVFVGANPLVLILCVGGAHNDSLLMLSLAGALALLAATPSRPRAAALTLVAGVGVKLSAALVLPFLVLGRPAGGERARAAIAALGGLAALALLGVIGFGGHALGFLDAIGEQQQLVATHSVPAETARLLGIAGTPEWWRRLWVAAFAAFLVLALWRTARGGDWRVWAGFSLLALLLATAWLLPWYAVWPLPLAAVCADRRLRAAALVVCAYALLIHLSFADPLLTPPRHHIHYSLPFPVPGAVHRFELTGFQMLRDVRFDLRW